jgi:predicted enzyme related to lactoylglutathione lyase
MGDQTYEMIYAGDTMIGGYAAPKSDRQPSHWISYVSVEDVDAAVKAAAANGGKVVDSPYEIPGVGRTARIADPQGAEICPFKNAMGDPAEEEASQGRFFWNELHTTDTAKALAFYEKVVGFSSRAMDMGPGGTCHVLGSRRSCRWGLRGADRRSIRRGGDSRTRTSGARSRSGAWSGSSRSRGRRSRRARAPGSLPAARDEARTRSCG